MELLKVPGGLDPELTVKPAPDRTVGIQRLRLSTKAVKRHHLLLVQPLLKRMLRDQAVDLRKSVSVPSQSQVGFDLQALRDHPHSLEAGNDRRREPEICHICEGLAAPEAQA
jgi:hypothetical protein